MTTRQNDPQWLLVANREEIERRALIDVARLVVIVITIGLVVGVVLGQ